METEIISVGNELVLGQIVNTNVAYLAQVLQGLDAVAHFQTTVDDEPDRIVAAVKQAQKRADLVFVCGGLGPTDDDRTMPSVAAALGVDLELDRDHWARIQADFAARHLEMPSENIRQAYYLSGGEELANPVGLALGAMITIDGTTVVVLPGPPREFKAMVKQSLVPKLQELIEDRRVIATRTLHFVGRPESQLMESIGEALADWSGEATSYVQPTEIQVRLKVAGWWDAAAAERSLDEAEQLILAKEGAACFGVGEDLTLAGEVVKLLRAQGRHVTAAESLTGGLFQSTLCGVSGASNVFDGGFVTYAAEAKEQLVGVDPQAVADYGVVSAQVATQMAEGAREKMGTELGVSFTGVAGPDSLEGHPAGTVFVAIAEAGQPTEAWQLNLVGRLDRQAIREQSVAQVLMALYRRLTKKS